MKLFETVEQRRAIKHYNGEGMTEAEFEQLMSAVILSPTSYNIQNWRFVRVQDKALRAEIQLAAWGQEQVSAAAELIILCADNRLMKTAPYLQPESIDHRWLSAPSVELRLGSQFRRRRVSPH